MHVQSCPLVWLLLPYGLPSEEITDNFALSHLMKTLVLEHSPTPVLYYHVFSPTEITACLPLFLSLQAIARACFRQNYHGLSISPSTENGRSALSGVLVWTLRYCSFTLLATLTKSITIVWSFRPGRSGEVLRDRAGWVLSRPPPTVS